MAKKKTAKRAAFKQTSVAEKEPSGRTLEPSRSRPTGHPDPQSIATALKAAIGLIKAAGGVDRALEFVDDVQKLIEVCGSAEIARQTLQACRGVLESNGQSDHRDDDEEDAKRKDDED